MKKYDSYKASGVKWLGEIPEHWKSKPFGSIFKQVSIANESNEELLSVYLDKGVIKFSDVEEKRTNVTSEDLSKYQLVEEGDFVLNNQQAWRGSVGVSSFRGIISPAYIILKPKEIQDSKFFNYLLRNRSNVAHYLTCSKGVGTIQRNLYWASLKRVYLHFPPLSEQKAIAAFLDEKTAKIDQLIAIKEKEIDLLKERRQILIQELVTGKKIWDGNKWTKPTKTKDSGVDWIGEIPENWEVRKLKYLGTAIIGLTYAPEDLCGEEEGTLVMRSSNLNEGKFVYGEKENAYVKKAIPSKLTLKKDDILICSRNGSRDLIGKCAIVSNADEGHSFGAFTTVFRSKYNNYLFCILNSNIFKSLSGSFLTSTINQLTIGNLNSIQVPIPSSEEMVFLQEYIESIECKFTKAVFLKQQEIEKLKEYKTILIDNAVTGKMKVV